MAAGAAAAAAGVPPGKGRDISLAALRRHDPFISRIVDVASQVALYRFGPRAREWEKTDVEGTLFVYTRSASPNHGFTILNRLSLENRTEPITKDLDLQLQDPFLLYRNARLSIYGIWFYDQEECQRIAELMRTLTQHEQLRTRQGAPSPGEGRGADIVRMLTKAKDEYAKCKTCCEPKPMSSSSAIHSNPDLIKPVPAADLAPQHLCLTTLFGKQDAASRAPEGPLCPALQKLLVGGTELRPLSELPERRPHALGSPAPALGAAAGPVQPGPPRGADTGQREPSASRTQNRLEMLPGAPGPGPAAITVPGEAHPGRAPPAAATLSPGELLRKLQLVHPEPPQTCTRPALAARFPAGTARTGAGNPPESWACGVDGPAPLLQVLSPRRVLVAEAPALLMSPLLFTQPASPAAKEQDARLPPPGSRDPAAPAPPALTRPQLQEALLFLVQNDDSFLDIVYDAYLLSTTQAALTKPV